ncbi:PspC domain-containing protein [Agrococcus sp. BE272]|uniref:PspC domain-containing protein n=1 Tax=Agrococcus sp. BE272 TaxID=2817727 RepID=UPI0028624D00|nr:PspC domain-containing protein [Agrococcus sp. BE272]MDR7234705.1 phage shock protein PspC (stress-responsive transcriptional regulator) [Agrococcus sp. BE272]
MASVFDSIRRTGFRRGPSRLFAGICGGIAAQLRVNVWIVRLVMLVLFALPVLGWGLYLVVWALTPNQSGSIPLERWLGRR